MPVVFPDGRITPIWSRFFNLLKGNSNTGIDDLDGVIKYLFGRNIVDVTADYTITTDDWGVNVDASAGEVIITLPDATASITNWQFWVRKTDDSSNIVTIIGEGGGSGGLYLQPDGVSLYLQPDGVSLYLQPGTAGGQTINDDDSGIISYQYTSVGVRSDGTNWIITGS